MAGGLLRTRADTSLPPARKSVFTNRQGRRSGPARSDGPVFSPSASRVLQTFRRPNPALRTPKLRAHDAAPKTR